MFGYHDTHFVALTLLFPMSYLSLLGEENRVCVSVFGCVCVCVSLNFAHFLNGTILPILMTGEIICSHFRANTVKDCFTLWWSQQNYYF